jgi:hypothetical protein
VAAGTEVAVARRGWLVVLVALGAVILVGSLVSARGPFAGAPALAYDRFLADVRAGAVDEVTQWRDQLQVIEGDAVWVVTVPSDRDLGADLAAAEAAGHGIPSRGSIADPWLGALTPWIAGLVLIVGLLVWVPAALAMRSPAHRDALRGIEAT